MDAVQREAVAAQRHERQQRATAAARRAELRAQAEVLQREAGAEAQAVIAQLAAERDGADARAQHLKASCAEQHVRAEVAEAGVTEGRRVAEAWRERCEVVEARLRAAVHELSGRERAETSMEQAIASRAYLAAI